MTSRRDVDCKDEHERPPIVGRNFKAPAWFYGVTFQGKSLAQFINCRSNVKKSRRLGKDFVIAEKDSLYHGMTFLAR